MNNLIIISIIIIFGVAYLIMKLFRYLNVPIKDIKVIHALLLLSFYNKKKRTKKTYFIKANDKIKIGISDNIERRFRQILTSQPDAEIYGYVNENIEKQLHKVFKNHHYKKEWFYFNPIKNQIDNIIRNYNGRID